jgi:hypothetical protein
MGNTARHLELLHPPAEELNYTRQDRLKGVLVNTPTLTWTYTRTFLKERGKRDIRNSIDNAFQCNGMLFV